MYTTVQSKINMCQFPVAQYPMKHHKYVSVSSCTVHDEAS